MGMMRSVGWRRLLEAVNKFNDHIKADPETWPLMVITCGTIGWGVAATISKYFWTAERK